MRPLLAPKSEFDEAVARINSGDLAAAEARCRATLEAYPGDINFRALLGALLIKLNRAVDAEATLRQVIAEAPTFAKPHEDLGYLLIEQDRPGDALRCFERAVELDPKLDNA